MIVVTNKIKVKPGFADKMAPRFTKPGPLQDMEGFVKVEVLINQENEEHEELHVNMYWDAMEHFTAWRNSDVFKEAHRDNPSGGQESPILGNEILICKVASTLEAKATT